MTLLLTDDEIVPLLDMQDAVDVLEQTYVGYAKGEVLNAATSTFSCPGTTDDHFYRVWNMPASLPQLGITSIGLVTNASVRLPDGSSKLVDSSYNRGGDRILLFDNDTSELLAILSSNHIHLLRVAATSALGVKYLANERSATLGVLGTGAQAAAQVDAISLVRPLSRVLVYSRTSANREAFAEKLRQRFSFEIEARESSDDVVDGSDIITSATSSWAPTFDGSLVRPGSHVNTLSQAQVDGAILRRASVFASTKALYTEFLLFGQSRVFNAECDLFQQWDSVQELEHVMVERIPGRRSEEEITLFFGLGAGLQLGALGFWVFQRARERDIGHTIPSEWFANG